jgi:hypothetical protein
MIIATFEPDDHALGLPRTQLSECPFCGAVILEEIPNPELAR